MRYIEIILLVLAYSSLILVIFVSFLCYKKKIEKVETLVLAISLLVLIISITIPSLIGQKPEIETTNVFILLSMVLVGLTTPLSILAERKINFSIRLKYLLYTISTVLFVSTCVAYFTNHLQSLEKLVALFLGVSVVTSMLVNLSTKPQKSIAHLERSNRRFAILFIIIVPSFLIVSYVFVNKGHNFPIGFVLPLVFILLALHKLFDDLQRLSLLNPKLEPSEQQFKNFSLTPREKEIATLLVTGKTYKQIGEELFISIPTVKTHTSHIYKKCQVNNKVELAILVTS